jgi:hypothetical protein
MGIEYRLFQQYAIYIAIHLLNKWGNWKGKHYQIKQYRVSLAIYSFTHKVTFN